MTTQDSYRYRTQVQTIIESIGNKPQVEVQVTVKGAVENPQRMAAEAKFSIEVADPEGGDDNIREKSSVELVWYDGQTFSRTANAEWEPVAAPPSPSFASNPKELLKSLENSAVVAKTEATETIEGSCNQDLILESLKMPYAKEAAAQGKLTISENFIRFVLGSQEEILNLEMRLRLGVPASFLGEAYVTGLSEEELAQSVGIQVKVEGALWDHQKEIRTDMPLLAREAAALE